MSIEKKHVDLKELIEVLRRRARSGWPLDVAISDIIGQLLAAKLNGVEKADVDIEVERLPRTDESRQSIMEILAVVFEGKAAEVNFGPAERAGFARVHATVRL
ncbi:MAG: hypothetical protein ABI397_01010 [Candidatus Saccharimonas sp.]